MIALILSFASLDTKYVTNDFTHRVIPPTSCPSFYLELQIVHLTSTSHFPSDKNDFLQYSYSSKSQLNQEAFVQSQSINQRR